MACLRRFLGPGFPFQGPFGTHAGSGPRGRFQDKLAAQQGRPFAHPEQAPGGLSGQHQDGVKASSLVGNLQTQGFLVCPDPDLYLVHASVAGDIGERLLNNAIGGSFNLRSEPSPFQAAVSEDYLHLGLGLIAFKMPQQGRQQPQIVQHGRPQVQG